MRDERFLRVYENIGKLELGFHDQFSLQHEAEISPQNLVELFVSRVCVLRQDAADDPELARILHKAAFERDRRLSCRETGPVCPTLSNS